MKVNGLNLSKQEGKKKKGSWKNIKNKRKIIIVIEWDLNILKISKKKRLRIKK